jgi:hypothetical protein
MAKGLKPGMNGKIIGTIAPESARTEDRPYPSPRDRICRECCEMTGAEGKWRFRHIPAGNV